MTNNTEIYRLLDERKDVLAENPDFRAVIESLKPISEGIKRNPEKTLSEISNFSLLSDVAKDLFNNKVQIIKSEYIEDVECIKTLDEKQRVSYFNPGLFEYVRNTSEVLYLAEDGFNLVLVGVFGNNITVCAPYLSSSVEEYID